MTSYPNSKPHTLSDSHRRMLYRESGIDPGVAEERGYRTVKRRADLEEFPEWQRRLGLYVPMFSPDGITRSCQLRPDRPRRDGPKYETPAGSEALVDVHPRMLSEVRDGSGDLWITEGAKKGDALSSRGLPALSLAGVWMWCVPKVRPYRLKPCFDHVRLKGRRVYVVFDNDAVVKAEVQEALTAFVEALEDAGAEALVVYLPDGPLKGVDDYLAAGHTVAELRILARKFEPSDVARIRLSRDEKLRARVEDLEQRWWREEWKGRGGHSDRDIAHQLIEAAAKRGKVHANGIRVRVSWGVLQVGAKVARRTLAKALARLEERGFCYRDNEGRQADKSGAFVLRANVDQGRGKATQATTGLRAYDPGGLPLRALPEVPRLRWPRPKYTPRRGTVYDTRKVRESEPQDPRDRIERLGKIRGAVVDALEVAGGKLALAEMCSTLHKSRPRDVRRRVLPMLEEAGVIECADDVITLAADWRERLNDARRLGLELEADELAERRRKLKSRAYRNRQSVEPSPHWANTFADGTIEDLRRADEVETVEPKQDPACGRDAEIVLDYVRRLGRIRLGLLEEIWLEEHGGDLKAMRRAVDGSGVRRERLREYRNAVFLFPPREEAA